MSREEREMAEAAAKEAEDESHDSAKGQAEEKPAAEETAAAAESAPVARLQARALLGPLKTTKTPSKISKVQPEIELASS